MFFNFLSRAVLTLEALEVLCPDSLFLGMNITRAADSDSSSRPRASAETLVTTHCLHLPEQTHQQCHPPPEFFYERLGRYICTCPETNFGAGAQQECLDASVADVDAGQPFPKTRLMTTSR